MSPEQLEALDRMDLIASCWRAISVLLSTDGNALQDQGRDEVSLLAEFLNQEYEAARAAFAKAKK